MNSTHDNPAGWRDLADELTPEQVERLELIERGAVAKRFHGHADEVAAHLLEIARGHAAANLRDAVLFAHLPVPAGRVYGWEDNGDDQPWSRRFTATVHSKHVCVEGVQYSDGRIERSVCVYADDGIELTAAQARQLAAALTEAADEIESTDNRRG